MKGSWSIKKIVPTISSGLSYAGLHVSDGTMAQQAFMEYMNSADGSPEKEKIRRDLLEYCKRDTEAMVTLVDFFSEGLGGI
jgi:hypothetical protein